MKTSINFKAAKSDSEVHNFRKKSFSYIRQDLSKNNQYWNIDSISKRKEKVEIYCKEKSGRKLQKNAMPIREAVVVTKENTTMLDLHNLSKKLEEELGIKVFQIAIHKDEGHYDKVTNEWKPNLHAHLVADWQNLDTGKTLKHQRSHYSRMQDLAAECLGMDRGLSGSVRRLEAVEFKIQKKEEEYKQVLAKFEQLKIEFKNADDLVVKKNDFLGFKKIETEKTILKFEEAYKVLKTENIKKESEVNAQNEKLKDAEEKIQVLKKEYLNLENKLAMLYSNPQYYSQQSKNYLKTVAFALEQEIGFRIALHPHRNRTEDEDVKDELFEIASKLSAKNNIPQEPLIQLLRNNEYYKKLIEQLREGNKKINSSSPEVKISTEISKIRTKR